MYKQSPIPFPRLNTICPQGEPKYWSWFSLLRDSLVLCCLEFSHAPLPSARNVLELWNPQLTQCHQLVSFSLYQIISVALEEGTRIRVPNDARTDLPCVVSVFNDVSALSKTTVGKFGFRFIRGKWFGVSGSKSEC